MLLNIFVKIISVRFIRVPRKDNERRESERDLWICESFGQTEKRLKESERCRKKETQMERGPFA